jgi:biotin carboxyl carrier protein
MAETIVLRIGERDYRVEVQGDRILVDGAAATSDHHACSVADGDTRWVFLDGETYEFEVQRPGRKRAAAHHGSLTAPMPATVRRILVQPGEEVVKGDTLLVLEAMKMELPVRTPSAGIVKSISCREGELVQAGVALVELE